MKKVVFSVLGICFMTTTAFANHPLVTDDTDTQGKGGVEVALGFSYFYDKEKEEGATLKNKGAEASIEFAVGLFENLDILLGVPYLWFKVDGNGYRIEKEDGLSDIEIAAKWRFFEKDGWSLGLKPGISLPAGNEDKGLGTGRFGYSMFLIGTKEIEPVAFHANLGYIRNENKFDERKDIWHVSVAAELEVIGGLKLMGDIGMERNEDPDSNNHPAYVLGGLSYDITEKFTVSAGVKYGLTSTEDDWTLLTGLTLGF